MRSRYAIWLIGITLVLATALAILQTLPPSVVPAHAPVTEFSAERAILHIEQIAQKPHPTGSVENELVRTYILTELRDLGLEVETQRDGDLENVMGRIVGTDSTDAILLTAHLDSTSQSPGATDDASGVAVLLETARALQSSTPLKHTIIFLFTDHEEGGTYGAQAFITHHAWTQDVKLVIGFDAGGIGGPSVLSTSSSENGWLIRQLIEADPYIVGSSAINALAYSSTDFGRAFKSSGFSGYAFDLYWDKRDGPEDTIENLNWPSIQHQGYHALSLARHFGNRDDLTDPKESDIVFFSFLRLFVVHYSPIWAILIAILVTVLFGVLIMYGVRHEILTWGGMVYGTFTTVTGLAVASLPYVFIELILGHWVVGVTADWDNRLIDQPAEMSIIVCITLALVTLWYAVSTRIKKTTLPNLTLGALLPLLAGMIVATALLPTLSYGFAWPLCFSLLACTYWLRLYRYHKKTTTVLVVLLLSGALSTIIIVPTILLGLFDKLFVALISIGALCGFLTPHIYLMLGHTLENEPIP